MSDTPLRQAVQEASSNPAAEATPTTTHYRQLAAKVSAVLSEAAAQMPDLESSHPATIPSVRANKSVPPEFMATVSAAVEGDPELQQLRGFFDPTGALDAQQYDDAFRPVAIQAGKLARDINFSIDARKARSASSALAVYAFARRVARNPSKTSIHALAQLMKRDLGRTRPKARTPEAAPSPAGETPTP